MVRHEALIGYIVVRMHNATYLAKRFESLNQRFDRKPCLVALIS